MKSPSIILAVVLLTLFPIVLNAQKNASSHPPLHTPVFSSELKKLNGPVYYVDASKGDDANPGTVERPWKTVQHSILQLRPGDTLLLRGGIYYENVYCAITGTPDKPITVRGYPGETAVLDGGYPEFQNDPANAWQPGEVDGEFVSTKEYRNIRDVLGLFGDSNVGLQTYWHKDYLLTESETTAEGNAKPFYCGPGIYYNKASGKIHVRLAHTHQKREGFINYAGETDPRKLPLVIAPFRSVPLFLDQAMHVRFRDLVIRGGGFNTMVMHFAVDVELDYVTIYGGSYCLRAKNSGPVAMRNSALVGQIPPWGYWSDNALQTYDGTYYDPWTQPEEPRPNRNVARLPTHALLVTEGGEESDVFCLPYNNHWTVEQCEFMDSHDGIYFNGRKMELNHCLMERVQDDGFYLSSPTPQDIMDETHIYNNYIIGSIAPFGAHLRGATSGQIFVYGNIADMRHLTQMYRPNDKWPDGRFMTSGFFIVHGRGKPRGMENIGFYHNTCVFHRALLAGVTWSRTHPDTVREVFNNIFVYMEELPSVELSQPQDGLVNMDGNLHWAPGHDPASPEEWIASIRDSVASRENVTRWNGQLWAAHSRYGNPKFRDWKPERLSGNDYRLGPGSAAQGIAVDFPNRAKLKGNAIGPAAGALQGDEQLKVGINRRVTAGEMK